MICCTKTNNAIFFSSIEKIPQEVWKQLDCLDNNYFHPDFLISLEKNNSEVSFSYVVLVDEHQKAIAFASIQIIDFHIDALRKGVEFLIRKIKNIARKIGLLPNKKPFKILICGNVFMSGEHGVFIKKNKDKRAVTKELTKSILQYVNTDKILKKEVNVFLIKDFINASLFITDELKEFRFNPFLVEPNMVLYLQKRWQSFDDYLGAMKTKFRVKAKKAFALSNEIKIENVTPKNIDFLLPKMTSLYKKVASKADFNLGNFNLKTYKSLKEKLGDKYILKTYFLEDKIVGFISGIINNNSLDAHFVGIDYQLNRSYAIYQRMLYDYVEIAIDKKIKKINFGRTASEIKSSIGAIPEDLTIYIRHKKSITNKILKLFLQRIEPTPFQQKFPFKKEF